MSNITILQAKISSFYRFFIIFNFFNLLRFWLKYIFWSISSTKSGECQRKSSFAVSLFENVISTQNWQGHFLRVFGSFSNYFDNASKWQSQAQLWKKKLWVAGVARHYAHACAHASWYVMRVFKLLAQMTREADVEGRSIRIRGGKIGTLMIHILLSSYCENDQKIRYFHFISKKWGFEGSLVALSCLNRESYAKVQKKKENTFKIDSWVLLIRYTLMHFFTWCINRKIRLSWHWPSLVSAAS